MILTLDSANKRGKWDISQCISTLVFLPKLSPKLFCKSLICFTLRNGLCLLKWSLGPLYYAYLIIWCVSSYCCLLTWLIKKVPNHHPITRMRKTNVKRSRDAQRTSPEVLGKSWNSTYAPWIFSVTLNFQVFFRLHSEGDGHNFAKVKQLLKTHSSLKLPKNRQFSGSLL